MTFYHERRATDARADERAIAAIVALLFVAAVAAVVIAAVV